MFMIILNVLDGALNVPDEALNEPDGALNVPDEGYSRNVWCALILIFMFLLTIGHAVAKRQI
jgi:hypothetical protein